MNNRKISVTIIKSGLNIKKMLLNFLKNIDYIEVDYSDNLSDYPKTDFLICSLELTHSNSIYEVTERVKKYLSRYKSVVFCEPSSLSCDKLWELGYKSIHKIFPENRMFEEINFSLFCDIGIENHVTSVSQYGYNPAYHVKSTQLIAVDNNIGIDYHNISSRENLVLNFPVFDMELFVLSQFDAPKIDLSPDVELIQYRLLQPNASAGNMLLQDFRDSKEVGKIIYETTSHEIDELKNRIRMPMVLDDCLIKTNYMNEKMREWCDLISFSYEKISIVRLNNCIITGCGFLYSDNKPIAKSDYLLPFLTSSIYQPIWRGLEHLHPLRFLNGPTVVAFNHLYTNYYHFLAECLQASYLIYKSIRKSNSGEINIVTCKLKGFAKEYFEILFSSDPNVKIVELSEMEYIKADEVYYSPELLGFTTPQPCLLAERYNFKDAIMKNLYIEIPHVSNEMIYISRKDTKARKILNEDELIVSLEMLGVKIIELEGKSVKEQIKIFSQAILVMGGHGAGMSNSLFMNESAVIMELIQASYQNVGPMRLAQSSGAQYISMLFFENGEGDSWYVDIERICRFIKHFKQTKLI
ncbi:glycosyltransferase family 61 protein [Acetobacter persici]|uniref:glycosyltransferase family 61 protein n=1 Tax=Acetobacter persici TaxID=1076596 RepID=UPI001BAC7648|nr:glycosyltransferase family 61 protein [Acetobacter persici]